MPTTRRRNENIKGSHTNSLRAISALDRYLGKPTPRLVVRVATTVAIAVAVAVGAWVAVAVGVGGRATVRAVGIRAELFGELLLLSDGVLDGLLLGGDVVLVLLLLSSDELLVLLLLSLA